MKIHLFTYKRSGGSPIYGHRRRVVLCDVWSCVTASSTPLRQSTSPAKYVYYQ